MSKLCRNCDAINNDGLLYCSSCGKPLDGTPPREKISHVHLTSSPVSGSIDDMDYVVPIGMWIGISILLAIPIVNIISMLFLAFGSSNKNLSNYGKAGLILIGISLVLIILLRACGS